MVLEALARLNDLSGGAMTLFVVDSDGCVRGSLTDGDVRRALLAGMQLECTVDRAAQHDFRFLQAGKPDVELIRDCRRRGLRSGRQMLRVTDNWASWRALPQEVFASLGMELMYSRNKSASSERHCAKSGPLMLLRV